MSFVPHGDSGNSMPLSMLPCRQVMSAPNLLRVGTPENIFVECQDCTSGNINVEIRVMNHPTKAEILKSTTVPLNSGNNFQALGQITVKVNLKKSLNVHSARTDPLLILYSFLCIHRFLRQASIRIPTSSSMCTCKLSSQAGCWRKW